MITSFDDYCIHQTWEPIAHRSECDRNAYDRYWFGGGDMGGDFFFEIGCGFYPNRHVMDGHFSVSLDGAQRSFHSSRRCPLDRSRNVIGPFEISIEEPLRQVRLRIAANDTGISCDLLFKARSTPTEEGRNYLQVGVRPIMDNVRFTQFGSWQGWMEIDGRRVEVRGERTVGVRDRSWGIRPVGEPEVNPAPHEDLPEPTSYWVWSPVCFEDVATQFGTFERPDGTPMQLDGCMAPVYDDPADIPDKETGHKDMRTVRHKLKWAPGTRRAVGGEFEFVENDETTHKLELTALNHFYMRGIGYQHPEWGHGVWKGEEVIGGETWKLDEVDPLEFSFIHAHALCKAKMGDREGIGIIETMVLNKHKPSGFKDFLDGAAG